MVGVGGDQGCAVAHLDYALAVDIVGGGLAVADMGDDRAVPGGVFVVGGIAHASQVDLVVVVDAEPGQGGTGLVIDGGAGVDAVANAGLELIDVVGVVPTESGCRGRGAFEVEACDGGTRQLDEADVVDGYRAGPVAVRIIVPKEDEGDERIGRGDVEYTTVAVPRGLVAEWQRACVDPPVGGEAHGRVGAGLGAGFDDGSRRGDIGAAIVVVYISVDAPAIVEAVLACAGKVEGAVGIGVVLSDLIAAEADAAVGRDIERCAAVVAGGVAYVPGAGVVESLPCHVVFGLEAGAVGYLGRSYGCAEGDGACLAEGVVLAYGLQADGINGVGLEAVDGDGQVGGVVGAVAHGYVIAQGSGRSCPGEAYLSGVDGDESQVVGRLTGILRVGEGGLGQKGIGLLRSAFEIHVGCRYVAHGGIVDAQPGDGRGVIYPGIVVQVYHEIAAIVGIGGGECNGQ